MKVWLLLAIEGKMLNVKALLFCSLYMKYLRRPVSVSSGYSHTLVKLDKVFF